ncbi:hypothetical protein ACIQCJ_07465 [Streptomyces sp. NPDC093221]|uniref:hypothetical protein n=1 Tax=unclassified Streptomyces TaxID=2593676 RepID=UPI0033A1DF63
MTLKVAGFTKTIGAGGANTGRSRQGWVLLTASGPLVWEDRRSRQQVELAGPVKLVGEGERVPGAFKFRRFKLTTGDGSYDLAVPTDDVETVRYALGAAV